MGWYGCLHGSWREIDIDHHGFIQAQLAFDGRDGNDTFINDGKLDGSVWTGDGNDLFDGRGGTITNGDVRGGAGNDTFILSQQVTVIEIAGGGTDTVKSTVSFRLQPQWFVENLLLIGRANVNATGSDHGETIRGNVGNNVLKGGAGSDVLDGGAGNDTLFGNKGADTFGFATGYGRDVIGDFGANDRIYLHNWKAIDSFTDIRSHATDHGNDVWITAGHDTLIIDGLHKADLNAGDFQF